MRDQQAGRWGATPKIASLEKFMLHMKGGGMILEVSWDGLWTLSFGLSLHGHGSWLVGEVALRYTPAHFLFTTFLKKEALNIIRVIRLSN